MIVKNPTITYQEVFNKLCELNERQSSGSNSDYKFNWISKAEFNNIMKQLNNLTSVAAQSQQAGEATIDNLSIKTIDTYSID